MINSNKLTTEEVARYARHIAMPEFGLEGQKQLKKAKVLVIGAGGLGSPLLLYLAAAGVGTIGIVDFDKVDESNLQRQVLFSVTDIGKFKVLAAKARLEKLNPNIRIVAHKIRLSSENALYLFSQYDLVADGSDNFPTRYLVNDACSLAGKTLVYGCISQFEGQASVFNFPFSNGTRGPNYRDMFPVPPPPGLIPNCAEGGVLGALPGIIGSIQAGEVIKILTGIGEPLVGRLFLFDAASFTTRILKIQKNPSVQISQLIDYEQFCGLRPGLEQEAVKEVTSAELKEMMERGADFQLIDVREPFEHAAFNIGGELIPLGQIPSSADRLSREQKLVVYCRSGARSAKAIHDLESLFGFKNLYNLKGGILAWQEESGE